MNEYIQKQPTINVGTIGHVAHGKTTLVKMLTGINTAKHSSEKVRNMTIRLGYANCKIWECNNCPSPQKYQSTGSSLMEFKCTHCNIPMTLIRHISLTDCFAPNTKVLMYDGTCKEVQNIKIGDKVMGDDGTPRNVTELHTGTKNMYKIIPYTRVKNHVDINEFTVSEDHIMTVAIDTPVRAPTHNVSTKQVYFKVAEVHDGIVCWKKYAWSYDRTGTRKGHNTTRVLNVEQALKMAHEEYKLYKENITSPLIYDAPLSIIMKLPTDMRNKLKLFKPRCIDFGKDATETFVCMINDIYETIYPESKERITPEQAGWFIGLWLGDGSTGYPLIHINRTLDQETVDKLTDIANKCNLECEVLPDNRNKGARVKLSTCTGPPKLAYNMKSTNVNKDNILACLLTKLGIYNNKHFPNVLLKVSPSIRLSILAGLIDSDGNLENHHGVRFCVTQNLNHELISRGCLWISRSLGFSTSIAYHGPHYRIAIKGDLKTIPTALSRKKTNHVSKVPGLLSSTFTTEFMGPGKYYGFTIDSNQRFLLEDFTVVHNCPGHENLMATMLNGAAIMDAAMLIVSADTECPQPQTVEHVAAVDLMGLDKLIIAQNKVDLVRREQAERNYSQIGEFVDKSLNTSYPIIPISAQHKLNIDVIVQYLATYIPSPDRDLDSPPLMTIVRSFDINKPGTSVNQLKGGVVGGTLIRGKLNIGQEIEIRPGLLIKQQDKVIAKPLTTVIMTMNSEENSLDSAVPGGLIGVCTKLDPTLTRTDRLIGHVLGIPGYLPPIFNVLKVKYYLMTRENTDGNTKLKVDEHVKINVGSMTINGHIRSSRSKYITIELDTPCCVDLYQKISISRRLNGKFRLIGYGIIITGECI